MWTWQIGGEGNVQGEVHGVVSRSHRRDWLAVGWGAFERLRNWHVIHGGMWPRLHETGSLEAMASLPREICDPLHNEQLLIPAPWERKHTTRGVDGGP